MAEKVTKMLIKVDLQCSRCHKKIKKILCKFPQIRDQVYDEKQNTVSITVLCCSPEKIKDKIICKGGETVQSVKILPDKPEEPKKKPEESKPKPKPGEQGAGHPPVPLYPMVGVCCCPPRFGWYGGGPCYCRQGRPVMCYDGCGRPAWECQGGNRGYHVRGWDCLSEDNATACTVM